MEQLLVRLGANHTDPISWLVYSRTEDEIIASGELPNADALSSLTAVSYTHLTLPTKRIV